MGDAFIKGSGNTGASYALTIQSLNGTQIARFQNGGVVEFDVLNPNRVSLNSNGTISSPTSTFMQVGQGATDSRLAVIRSGNLTTQTGNVDWVAINTSIDTTRSFAPTTGTATMSMIRADIIVNQTGGANGITRGLYVNPTLTAAADWRSIEWSNNSGWGLYGAGTAPNFLGGNTTISRNQNATTSLTVSNTTAGTSSYTELILQQDASAGLGAVGKMSSISNPAGIITSSNTYIYNGTAGDIAIYNAFATGKIKFSAGAVTTPQMTLTAAGRLLLGTTTESTFALDVNGTARVSGNVTITGGSTAQGTFIGSGATARYTSNTGINTNAIYTSAIGTTDDVIASYQGGGAIANLLFYVQSTGYIGTKGGLRLGAATGTDVLTQLTNTWLNVAAGTTARSQINLASSTAPTSPNNGDIWFDGTNLNIRVGGVTRTIVLL
jgi:hypothetical protein